MDSTPFGARDGNARENGIPVRRTGQKRRAAKDTESLDYHLIHNDVQKRRCQGTDWFSERSVLGYECKKLSLSKNKLTSLIYLSTSSTLSPTLGQVSSIPERGPPTNLDVGPY
jgi:hypothetical protein